MKIPKFTKVIEYSLYIIVICIFAGLMIFDDVILGPQLSQQKGNSIEHMLKSEIDSFKIANPTPGEKRNRINIEEFKKTTLDEMDIPLSDYKELVELKQSDLRIYATGKVNGYSMPKYIVYVQESIGAIDAEDLQHWLLTTNGKIFLRSNYETLGDYFEYEPY